MNTTVTRAASPIPIHTSVSGIHASGGMGRRIWKTGKTIHFRRRHQAMAMPSGTPTMPATAHPARTIESELAMCSSSVEPR